jgi:hypothetical protein
LIFILVSMLTMGHVNHQGLRGEGSEVSYMLEEEGDALNIISKY